MTLPELRLEIGAARIDCLNGAITRYKKALGDPVGLAELPVLYGERAAGFCREVDHRDTAYLDALVDCRSEFVTT